MIKVAVTGANGFIGSNFVNAANGRFDLKLLRRSGPGGGNERVGSVSLGDSASLAKEMEGCEVLVHCAHDAIHESTNVQWAANIVQAAASVGIERIITFGSFVSYDNSGDVIAESTSPCAAKIPYVVHKSLTRNVFVRAVESIPHLRLAVLEPSIVVGAGGSWDRWAKRLQVTDRIYLPENGRLVCNLVEVAQVVEAICRCIEIAPSAYGQSRMFRALISGRPTSWADWLASSYDIQSARIEACNNNVWAEDMTSNLWLSFRYSAVGDSLFTALKSTRRASKNQDVSRISPKTERLTAAMSRNISYCPYGLDRLTLSCRAVAESKFAEHLGIL
jgi:nucleoside-diphosphate-sugar epimerase